MYESYRNNVSVKKENKMRNLVVLILLLTVSLSSCKLFDKSSTEKELTEELKKATVEKDLLVRISLGPCFGTCPVFKASIYEDGTVDYKGSMHVDKIGTYKTTIGRGKINDIRHMIRTAQFAALNENYDANIPDFPIYVVTAVIDGKEKKVKSQGDVPQNLKSLQKYLIKVIEEMDGWEKVEEVK